MQIISDRAKGKVVNTDGAGSQGKLHRGDGNWIGFERWEGFQ